MAQLVNVWVHKEGVSLDTCPHGLGKWWVGGRRVE